MTSATVDRSRAALLSSNLERLYEHRDVLAARLAVLPELEEEARVAALQQAPTQRTDKLGSPAQRLRAERTKKEGELDRVNAEIAAVERAAREAKLEELNAQLADTAREADAIARAEQELWRQAGGQLADLAETFGRLRDEVWELRDRRREEIRHGEMASVLNGDEEALEVFEGAWRSPVRPLPATFADFAAFLVEATVDPGGRGYRENTAWLDSERRLPGLVPDLRGAATRPVEFLRTERWRRSESASTF